MTAILLHDKIDVTSPVVSCYILGERKNKLCLRDIELAGNLDWIKSANHR